MGDLEAFLRARLDEDERYLRLMINVGDRVAERATPKDMADGFSLLMTILEDPDPQVRAIFEQCTSGTFVAPNGLPRLLRETEGKRAILDEHAPNYPGMNPEPSGQPTCNVCHAGGWDWDPEKWPCATARHLAAIYSDHPDYRDEWKL